MLAFITKPAVSFHVFSGGIRLAVKRSRKFFRAEAVTIGIPPLAQNALLYIADHRKFSSKP